VGSLIGAYVNYAIAWRWGRPFFERYGRYVLVSSASLDRCTRFFADHGAIATFVGRLIPQIRQLISLPAGLSRMNLALFTFFTGLGAGIWVLVLTYLGVLVGRNEALFRQYLNRAVLWSVIGAAIIAGIYVLVRRKHQSTRNRSA
jgi:membrane protein DedA with SNARE-associated domain